MTDSQTGAVIELHIMVITKAPVPGEDDDFEAHIECPGVTGSCQVWWECEQCRTLTDAQDDALWEHGEAHGVEHRHIDGVWMVPGKPTECITAHLDDNLWETAADAGRPGRFPVEFETEDGYITYRLTPTPSA